MRPAWLVAIGAGVLQTGGIIDVLFRFIRERVALLASANTPQDFVFFSRAQALVLQTPERLGQIIIVVKILEILLLALLLVVGCVALVILCQGALVYLVGVRGRFTRPTLAEAFHTAGASFWPLATLNLLPLGASVFAWFVFLAPFGTLLPLTSVTTVILYMLAITAALITGFLATSVHMLALQRVVLDKTHLESALKESYTLVKRSWITLIETALALFGIGAALFIAAAIACAVAVLPVLALVVIAIIFQTPIIADALILLCEALFFVVMFAVGGFMIVFQYTVWNRLSTRLEKNMAVSKLVRVVHQTLNRLKR